MEERYKILEEIKNKFWDLWAKDYLPELVHFAQSRKTNISDVKVGDVVLIGSEKSRAKWRLGRVQVLKYGKDGKVRAAQVKTSGKKMFNRPVQQLYPLETSSNHSIARDSNVPISDAAVADSNNSVPSNSVPDPSVESNDADLDEVFDAESTNVKKSRYGREVKRSVVYSRDDFVYDVDNI